MNRKKRMHTFIKIEQEWVPVKTEDSEGLPGTRLLVGKENLHIVHIN